MLHSILTKQTADIVLPLLSAAGYTDENSTFSIVAAGGGRQALTEAGRVPMEVLLLDLATGPGLGSAVLSYRLRNLGAASQRLILLAADAKPGDPEIARIVQAQVYDVVTDLSKLPAVLDKPTADLTAAVRWLDPRLTTEQLESKPTVPTTTQEIVYRERLIGSSVIAIAGAGRGVGSTTVALQVGQFLADYGQVAIVEMTRYPAFYALPEQGLPRTNIKLYPQTMEKRLYVEDIKNFISQSEMRQFKYVVLDLGAYWEVQDGNFVLHPHKDEMLRADLSVVVCGSWPWQLLDLRNIYAATTSMTLSDWHLILRSPADLQFAKDMRSDFSSVTVMPRITDPTLLSLEVRDVLKPILRDLIPASESVKKRGFFRK